MNFKHGATENGISRLYSIWRDMKTRCYNPKSRSFKTYGARGITVCDEWKNFILFKEWALSNGYLDTLTINRIDNDGDYCPSNCEWVTKAENNRLRPLLTGSKNHKTVLTAEKVLKIRNSVDSNTELGNIFGVSESTIRQIRSRKTWNHI